MATTVGGEGAGLRLGGARQQLVLAMLLAEANTVVSTDALVDGLWGDSPPSAARHTVQGYVSELRKLLGPVIEREGTGYVVRVDESSLDSFEFESLIEQGRVELADDPEAAPRRCVPRWGCGGVRRSPASMTPRCCGRRGLVSRSCDCWRSRIGPVPSWRWVATARSPPSSMR